MLAALALAVLVSHVQAAPPCVNLRSPTTNFTLNAVTIQAALDDASLKHGCVSVGGGDWPVAPTVLVRSNTLLRIEKDTRLLNVINQTVTAVVHVANADNVVIEGVS
jgi:hypothetical protein